MDRDQGASSVMLEGLRGLFSSFEKLLSAVGVSLPEVENLKKMTESAAGEAPAAEAPPQRREKRLERITLTDGEEIEAEVKSESTKAGRTRNYYLQGRKKVLLAKKNGRWQERSKAERNFEGYEPAPQDIDLLLKLNEFNSQGKRPGFMELADSLGKSRGELLGRYRNVSGAKLVDKDNETYGLTAKGQEFVNAQLGVTAGGDEDGGSSGRSPRKPRRKKA